MEPGIREFLKRILNSMCLALLWMLVNATAGIKYGLGFPEATVKWPNIVFYIWLLASLAWLIWYIIRLWKKPFVIED